MPTPKKKATKTVAKPNPKPNVKPSAKPLAKPVNKKPVKSAVGGKPIAKPVPTVTATPLPPKPPTVLTRRQTLEGRAQAGILRRSEAKELEDLKRAEEKPILPFPVAAGATNPQNDAPAAPVGSPASATLGEPTPALTPFAQQLVSAITHNEANADNSPHVIVTARAGTGKTTTLVEGLKELMGIGSKLEPSPQQRAVWDAICMSKGKVNSVAFVAFNKSIAKELKERVPVGCDAMTMHGLGFKALNKAFNRLNVQEDTVDTIIALLLQDDLRAIRQKQFMLLRAVDNLVSLCKMNLTNANDQNELENLVSHYEVNMDGVSTSTVYDLVPQVLEACKDVASRGCINYDDMIWLPVVLGLPVSCYDLLMVDEAQDLNRCQQALAKLAGKRLILCGDPKQAIYGFAGADAESMPRMARELGHRLDYNGDESNPEFSPGRGCVELPLTVTRRCGHAIVKEAQKLVPDFDAFHSNPPGKVTRAQYQTGDGTATYLALVEDGDMVLCRINAPLVSQCFRFLKSGRKATIVGRDIGKGLISTIKKMDNQASHGELGEIPALVAKVTDWGAAEVAKEQAKRSPSESKIIAVQDRVECIIAFTEGASTVAEVVRKIEQIFTDQRDQPGIRLSSIHKAKGLEAKRVFLLQPKGASIPHPMAKSVWQREQEYNLLYVAITRAIEELVHVS